MSKEEIEVAISDLTSKLLGDPNNEEMLLSRGKFYMKLGDRSAALNDFTKLLSSNSSHGEAESYILMLRSIDDYFYNQMYNV